MKKTAILFCGVLGAATSTLAQGPVYSVNIVGIQKVSVDPNKYQLTCNPFAKTSNSLADVIGTQVDSGLAPNEADRVYVFDNTSNQYKTYFLYRDPNNSNDPDNDTWFTEGYQPASETLTPGKGFFIQNAQGGVTNVISFVGDVVSTPQISVQINPGLNQISYPYSTTINIAQLALKVPNGAVGATGPNEADNIYLWDADAGTYVRHFLYYDSSNPGDPDNNSWLTEGYLPPPNPIIQPGQAFFYQRVSSAPALNWVENKPY